MELAEAHTDLRNWALVWQHLAMGTGSDLAIAAEEWAKAGRSLKEYLVDLSGVLPKPSLTSAGEDPLFVRRLAPWLAQSTFTDERPEGAGWSFAWTLFDDETAAGRITVRPDPLRFTFEASSAL